MPFTFRAFCNHAALTVDIFMRDLRSERTAVALPIAFRRLEDNEVVEPALRLEENSAQSLFQSLWDAGLRPASGEGLSAVHEALRDHVKFAEEVARTLLAK